METDDWTTTTVLLAASDTTTAAVESMNVEEPSLPPSPPSGGASFKIPLFDRSPLKRFKNPIKVTSAERVLVTLPSPPPPTSDEWTPPPLRRKVSLHPASSSFSSCSPAAYKHPAAKIAKKCDSPRRVVGNDSEGRRRRSRRSRQEYHHNESMAVLAIGSAGGYTLSNGIVSCCEDENESWMESLVYDMKNAFSRVKHLYTVDRRTSTEWGKVRNLLKSSEGRLKRMKDVVLEPNQRTLGICNFCYLTTCHRYRAIVGGVQHLFQYPVDVIPH